MLRRGALFTLVGLAGCAFDPAGVPGAGGRDDEPPIDAASTLDGPATPRPCPASPDLVACYRFETAFEPAQPFDESAYGNHGTSSGVMFVAGPGGRGTAMAFAPGASALVPDSASLDVTLGITIEGWLLVDTLPVIGGRAGVVDNNGQYGLFLSPNSEIRCAIGSATAIGLAIPLGTWTHVACTFDGATIQLYQSGLPGASTAASGPMNTAGVDGLGLGQNVPDGDNLQGALDDVRIWSRPLSAEAVCASAGACPTP